jgi:hypothetical protein
MKPNTAVITDLGLSSEAAKKLSPAAQKLTKADLISILNQKPTANAGAVTIDDLQIIKDAYLTPRTGPGTLDVNCCCCAPCCCCSAATSVSAVSRVA